MANIFTLDNLSDFSEKISIDELYEKKRQHDLSKLSLFNKLLNRIHVRIKTTSRQKLGENYCWFVVPEVIIGVPKYDQGACIAYLMDKLKTNGFHVRYIDPNTLFISWMHFVPSYVRSELKKKTGIIVNEYGEQITDEANEESSSETKNNISKNPNDLMFNTSSSSTGKQPKKNYTPINSYKPSGNLVYDDELLNKIDSKFS
jgi:hypothetical protein